MRKGKVREFSGKSWDDRELRKDPSLEVDYIVAKPRMALYMEYSSRIYQVYLRHVAPEGYYVPDEIEENSEAAEFYRTYMDELFAAYHALLEDGIPKEDARFLLPYSFCSNFYCTINARELSQLIREMLSGRGANVPELQNLAHQLIMQMKDFPWQPLTLQTGMEPFR